MSKRDENRRLGGQPISGHDVAGLYRQLGVGETTETAWMGSDRKTLLWLLDNGEPIPIRHPERVAIHGYSRRIGDESTPPSWRMLDRVVSAVIAALATADLALIVWFAHVFLGWF